MKNTQKKPDRRVSRTRARLRSALLTLISEKRYLDITVEEITSRADLSRATFYLHYKDKEDLLLDYLGELADAQVSALADFSLAEWRLHKSHSKPVAMPIKPILAAFQHIAEYADLYQLVLRGDGVPRLSDSIGKIITRAVNRFLLTRLENEQQRFSLDLPVEFISSYFSGAFLGCVNWWLDTKLELSSEEITYHFQRMFIPGLRLALGFDETNDPPTG